jgi:hypothetical protein
MTLDEAINNFMEAAKNHRYEQQYWQNERDETSPLYEADRFRLADDSRESAEYYEQLAEWLTELKNRREVSEIEKRAIEKCDKCSDIFDCPLYYPWLKE